MQQLLESEGVAIEENQVQDFKLLFWDPITELGGFQIQSSEF
jgi:methylated-DNA-protein-cysteine methyltransferase-like protein